jgi:hypothetical protein
MRDSVSSVAYPNMIPWKGEERGGEGVRGGVVGSREKEEYCVSVCEGQEEEEGMGMVYEEKEEG